MHYFLRTLAPTLNPTFCAIAGSLAVESYLFTNFDPNPNPNLLWMWPQPAVKAWVRLRRNCGQRKSRVLYALLFKNFDPNLLWRCDCAFVAIVAVESYIVLFCTNFDPNHNLLWRCECAFGAIVGSITVESYYFLSRTLTLTLAPTCEGVIEQINSFFYRYPTLCPAWNCTYP